MKKLLAIILLLSFPLNTFAFSNGTGMYVIGNRVNIIGGRINVKGVFPNASVANTLIDYSECGYVQLGSSVASAATTTVNTYDTTRSALLLEGSYTDSTSAGASTTVASLYLTNGNTVTTTRGVSNTAVTYRTGWCLIQFSVGVTNSVQRGETLLQAGVLTATSTLITSVSPSTSVAITLAGNSTSNLSMGTDVSLVKLAGGSGTSINSTRGVSTDIATSTWEVIDFNSTYINSVQEGLVNMNSLTSGTLTLNPFTLNSSMLFFGGYRSNGGNIGSMLTTIEITNNTTLTGTKTTSATVAATAGTIVDFKSNYLKSTAQSGYMVLAGATTATTALSPTVTASKFILQQGSFYSSNANTNRAFSYINITPSGASITGTKQTSTNVSTSTFSGVESN